MYYRHIINENLTKNNFIKKTIKKLTENILVNDQMIEEHHEVAKRPKFYLNIQI